MLLVLLAGTAWMSGQETDTSKIKASYHEVNYFVEDNEGCLKCHGEITYTLEDTLYGMSAVKRMLPGNRIDRDEYYTSVHKSFSCTDCHDYGFYTFPHTLESRLTEHMNCIDCHGYDETYAHYRFEEIEMEYAESIHNKDGFSCWSCHDPHSYRAFIRNAEDIKEAIQYDNNICLSCHGDYDKFLSLSDREEINIMDTHDWLPNQTAHFAGVRCIECHTEISDSVLVAHKVLPGSEAVRNCAECHSADSRLMLTLYKFQSKEERKMGFINGVILNDSFVIGTTRIPLLDRISLIILLLTVLGIGVHVFIRILHRKRT
jgi:hypothetical protein